MHCVHCVLVIHHIPIPMTNAHLPNIKEPATKQINSCAKRERRNCYTVTREMSHCYPHFHHDSKISKVAWYLLVPWLRLLHLGSAFPVQSLHLWRPFSGLVFGLEVWSYVEHTDLRAPWFPPNQPITFVGLLVEGTHARIRP